MATENSPRRGMTSQQREEALRNIQRWAQGQDARSRRAQRWRRRIDSSNPPGGDAA